MVNRELALHFALRPDDGVEVGVLGGDVVVRRAGRRMLQEACARWLQEVSWSQRRSPSGDPAQLISGRGSGRGFRAHPSRTAPTWRPWNTGFEFSAKKVGAVGAVGRGFGMREGARDASSGWPGRPRATVLEPPRPDRAAA